jgi:hypothetical protein
MRIAGSFEFPPKAPTCSDLKKKLTTELSKYGKITVTVNKFKEIYVAFFSSDDEQQIPENIIHETAKAVAESYGGTYYPSDGTSEMVFSS